MKPVWNIKATRCVCALIRLARSTKTAQALPVCLTITLSCNQTQKQIQKRSLQHSFPKDSCSVLRPGCRGFYSLVNLDCLKSFDKTVTLQVHGPSQAPCSAVHPHSWAGRLRSTGKSIQSHRKLLAGSWLSDLD